MTEMGQRLDLGSYVQLVGLEFLGLGQFALAKMG